MSEKSVRYIIYLGFVFLLIAVGCTPNTKYGYPTDTLHSLDKLEYDNIEDLVLFTYVPYSNDGNDRQTVLVNIKTKKQYQFDDPNILRDGFYDIVYLENKMIIPDSRGNRYILYNDEQNKGVFQQIFTETETQYVLDVDENNALLVVNDEEKHEIAKINLNGETISTFKYKAIGDYDSNLKELQGYYTFNLDIDKLVFFGKVDNKDNQLFVFDESKNEWNNRVLLDETDRYVPSVAFNYNNYFILFVEQDNQLYFADLIANKVMTKESPINVSLDAKVQNSQLEFIHDNNLIFSALNLESNNLVINESYNFNQIIQEGIQRVNFINLNNSNELVFMTPSGLYVYDKNTKEIETIIFMDVNNF